MPNYCKIIVAGHLCRDIEIRVTQGGTTIGKSAIAYNERRGNEDRATFIDFTAFGKTAETLAKYLHKGSAVLLEGKIQQDNWTTDDGKKRSKLAMVVDRFAFLGRDAGGSPGSTAQGSGPGAEGGKQSDMGYDETDAGGFSDYGADIPF